MPAGLVEAGEEAGSPPARDGLATRRWPAATRLGSLGEVLGAQQLAAERPGEQLVGCVLAESEEAGEEGRRAYGSDGGPRSGCRSIMVRGECYTAVSAGRRATPGRRAGIAEASGRDLTRCKTIKSNPGGASLMPRRRFPSDKIGADDPRYGDLVRRGFNQRFTSTPDYVRAVGSTAQVVEAVQDAVGAGLRLAARSGGHCLEGFVADPAVRVLIDTSRMNGTWYDPEMNAFAVEAGATLGEMYRKLFLGWGVTVPAGESPDIGVGGHVSGGAFGFLCREHGLAADHLYGVELVVVDETGTARTLVATRELSDPNRDLWWAHTGGGPGNFGIVTRCWFRSPGANGKDPGSLLPTAPESVLVFRVEWNWEQIDEAAFTRLMRNHGTWCEPEQRARFSVRQAVQHPLSPSPPGRETRAAGAVDRRSRSRAVVRGAPGRDHRGCRRAPHS